jgi:hypothetical protein
MKDYPRFPHIVGAPRVILRLPDNTTDAFRRGWASGQLEMLREFWRKQGDPLTKEEADQLFELILNGRQRKKT